MAEKKPAVETFVPRTKEEIALALEERRRDASALVPGKEPAGIAPAEVLASERATHRYVEAPRPAAPPAPVVNVDALTAAKQKMQALIDAKVIEMRKAEISLSEQEQNAKDLIAQMKAERQSMLQAKEAMERDVINLQRELSAVEASHLAAQAARDQAARGDSEKLPLEKWREKWREELRPIVTRIVSGLVKLRGLVKDKAATLEKVAALRSPPGIDEATRGEFIAISTEAGKVLSDLHASIVHHERVLAQAESFVPDPRSSDGKTAINGLRYDLELVSGIVTARLVDIPQPRLVNPSSGVEGQTNASIYFAERIGSLLEAYSSIQKRVNQTSRPMPTIEITLIPKGESKARHEVMAELRGPKPESTHAEGVPEGVK